MDKLIKIGVRYIRASSFFVLFLVFLYLIFALGNMLGATFYSTWGVATYIFLQILLPVYGGLLIFFILFLLSETFERTLIRKDKEEGA